jgi:hypothetical protein
VSAGKVTFRPTSRSRVGAMVSVTERMPLLLAISGGFTKGWPFFPALGRAGTLPVIPAGLEVGDAAAPAITVINTAVWINEIQRIDIECIAHSTQDQAVTAYWEPKTRSGYTFCRTSFPNAGPDAKYNVSETVARGRCETYAEGYVGLSAGRPHPPRERPGTPASRPGAREARLAGRCRAGGATGYCGTLARPGHGLYRTLRSIESPAGLASIALFSLRSIPDRSAGLAVFVHGSGGRPAQSTESCCS